jgi:hypothetical protein
MHMYHECGHPLWVDSIKEHNHCLTQFYDAREKRPQTPIIMCPSCHQALANMTAHQKAVFQDYALASGQ